MSDQTPELDAEDWSFLKLFINPKANKQSSLASATGSAHRCENCKHWTETKPEVRYGKCAARQITTEWCGVIWKTANRIRLCEHFASNAKVRHRENEKDTNED